MSLLVASLLHQGWAAEPTLPQGRGLGIFQIDVAQRRLVQLTSAASENLAVDAQGRLYFTQGPHLYVHDPGR